MKDILNILAEGNWWIVGLSLLVALIFNLRSISNYFEDNRRTHINRLNEAIESKNLIDSPTKKALVELLETEYFALTTGLRLDKDFRESVIDSVNRNNSILTFYLFRKAKTYLLYQNEKLIISISKLDKFMFYIGNLLGWAFALLGSFIIAASPLYMTVDIKMVGIILGTGCFTLFCGVFILYQSIPYLAARKIKHNLDG